MATEPPAVGVIISRAYWGLLVTLLVSAALAWTAALYVRLAKAEGASTLVPPNSTFEEPQLRNRFISWATVCVFTLVCAAALVVFGNRYSESRVYRWDDLQPLEKTFWASRVQAHVIDCSNASCFAVAQHFDNAGKAIHGVNEYIPYVTDGAIAVLALLLIAGLLYLVVQLASREKPRTYQL
ncbi:hypothetical protein [Rhizobium leguminosarum]|uniref:hypothetical protein n=1 Tax=Rhizobium leguminosarum TaxID=384 RepID=UPI001C8FE3D9|nr:hypothetical protein [Rhizobium leguminosarum]